MLYSQSRLLFTPLISLDIAIAGLNTTTSFLPGLWHWDRIKDNMITLILAVGIGRFWLTLSQEPMSSTMHAGEPVS